MSDRTGWSLVVGVVFGLILCAAYVSWVGKQPQKQVAVDPLHHLAPLTAVEVKLIEAAVLKYRKSHHTGDE